MEIEEWEQWFDVEDLSRILNKYCTDVIVQKNISYDDRADGLFCAWVGIV